MSTPPVIPTLPTAPQPGDSNEVWEERAAAWTNALPGQITAENALAAWMNATGATVASNANSAASNANAAAADRTLAQAAAAAVAAANPAANAAAAQAAAAAAQVYASQAQATNPDSPIRLNPRLITAAFTVPSGYNAASAGPISVADGVAVTVQTHAAWSVH